MGACMSSGDGGATHTAPTGQKKEIRTGASDSISPDPALAREGFIAKKFLGRGGTGDTWLFDSKEYPQPVAIKLIKRPLPKVAMPNTIREILIQAQLGEGHVNVINALEAILTDTHLCLVMEYAACGSLTSYVAEKWDRAKTTGLFLTEDEARYFFRQFVTAVDYCHQHLVAHRDLKLDNTLLSYGVSEGAPPLLKLCDFGFARQWEGTDARMLTQIGTPVYMSPELINARNGARGYDGKQVDVWASGVLLLVMLLGTFPFDHTENTDPNTSEAHLEVWLQQVRQPWQTIPRIKEALAKLSPECMDLLDKIFVIDEKKRITIAQIEAHPWYNMPQPEEFARAEAEVEACQNDITAAMASRKQNAKLVTARNQQLEKLVQEAGLRPGSCEAAPAGCVRRIDLREDAIQDVAAAAGMAAVGEAPEGEEALEA